MVMRSPVPFVGLHVVQHPRWEYHELSGFEGDAGNVMRIRQGHVGDARIHVHAANQHGVDEAQLTALLLAGVVAAGVDAVDSAPRGIRMKVHAEESAAPRDVEPAVVVDEQPVQGR